MGQGLSTPTLYSLVHDMHRLAAPQPVTFDNMYITYINLDHRFDRKQKIEQELHKIGCSTFTRFGAKKNKVHGAIGCVESHIACLTNGLASGKPYILVFEDDFEFHVSKKELQDCLHDLSHFSFDVFLLDIEGIIPETLAFQPTTSPKFFRVIRSYGAGGYLVTKEYALLLLACFVQAHKLMSLYNHKCSTFALDVCWNKLQQKHKWYKYCQLIGKQGSGYSDIGNMVKIFR